MKIIFSIILLLNFSAAISQSNVWLTEYDSLADRSNRHGCYPEGNIQNDASIFHTVNNPLPDTMKVTAVIVGYSPYICGFLCQGGSLKLKLSKKIKGYPYEYIYVATGCSDFSGKCTTEICFTAIAIMEGDSRCTIETVRNRFDMEKIPFYEMKQSDLKRILN
jgi:hypothetical protein